jgi:N-acetyl-gamma-glutamyl-phosphate reductase
VNRVCVVGASGFSGALCAELVMRHPELELVAITARSEVGRRLDSVHPRYRVALEFERFDPDSLASRCDAAFVCYPHGEAAEAVEALFERGLKVVDLSADFRLSKQRYELYYRKHPAPRLLSDAVYGLCEFHRGEVAGASLVAAPGCYPTAALFALEPIADLAADVVVDAKSGVSGAGRDPTHSTHFVSVAENVAAYKVEGHRHRAELEQELDDGFDITFCPHLLPIDQGLLASCYVRPKRPILAQELVDLYTQRYADERFVEVVSHPPGVREVRDTNTCRIHATVESATGRICVFSAIDNLWKGAASQALQNLNLMLGLPEAMGL